MAAGSALIVHPFQTESTDHCESPLQSYADIAPTLEALSRALGKTKDTVQIYDPYFCAGGVKKHLNSLGFPHVYNVCEDFYQKIRDGKTPNYDILVTNPPYSTKPFDHIERLMNFCVGQGKPYMILQPCYVYIKPYYVQALTAPFYITPSMRYTYRTPTGLRDVKANALSTSPFVTFWFCEAGAHRPALLKWWCEQGAAMSPGCKFKLTAKNLPRKFKDSNDPTRPRLRKKQREAIKRRYNKALGLDPFRPQRRPKQKKKPGRSFNIGRN